MHDRQFAFPRSPRSPPLRRRLLPLLFLLAVPLAAHLLFSWIGFNPTDDGFTLAYSRRLLEGQVPHRDFILLRPALSPLLHVPVVALGEAYTFWLSRLVVLFQLGRNGAARQARKAATSGAAPARSSRSWAEPRSRRASWAACCAEKGVTTRAACPAPSSTAS